MLSSYAQISDLPSAIKPDFEFVPNHGQWHPLAKYRAEVPYGHLYLESTGFVYSFIHPEDYSRIKEEKHHYPAEEIKEVPRRHAVRFRFLGIDYAPQSEARNVQSHYYNYYLGKDESKWASGVHPAGEVVYTDIYSGIDFEISGAEGIKYQWVIDHPTPRSVAQIRCAVEGATAISIVNERLRVVTTCGILEEDKPYVYQLIAGEKKIIQAKYILRDSIVSYELLEEVDPNYPLVIDPQLIFSTYSGSRGDNFGFTATYDSESNLYAGGIVDNQGPYPVTTGAIQSSWSGGSTVINPNPTNLSGDISLSKYDSAGTQLLWATYLGGADDEFPHSLVVDRNDDLIVLGSSFSKDYPVSQDGFDTTHGGGARSTDIVLTKLSADGRTLLGSTYIGGSSYDGFNNQGTLNPNYADDFRGDVITDDDNRIYIATCTRSDSMPTVNASQSQFGGLIDGYIAEFTPDLDQMIWGTYLGGRLADALFSIKLDVLGRVYVGGASNSMDLPTTDSSYQQARVGLVDGVVAYYDEPTKELQQITYWGTEQNDYIYFIGIDARKQVYATGQTEGSLTKSAGVYGEDSRGQFVTRLDSNLTTSDLVTTFGNRRNAPNLVPSAFLIDVCDHIYFSGWGSSATGENGEFNTNGMEVTSDAEQGATDGNDFYILVLDKDASGLLYATYFGGDSTADHVDGGTSRFDKRGVIYQSVCSSCPGQGREGYQDFPTSPGVPFTKNPSVRCSNASFKIDLQIKTAVIADFVADPTLGCSPLPVQFTNSSVLGEQLIWDFGDGDTSHQENPTHTYIEPGNYIVTLTVIDSSTCNILSTYQRTIAVIAQSNSLFTASFSGCDNKLTIDNQSENGYEYLWDFGNGETTDAPNPSYKYDTAGTYTITLTVNPGSECESTSAQTVTISPRQRPKVNLYNVFTPNNDGFNDCFFFDGDFLECTEFNLKIYNRWGERVFTSTEPTFCWNGGYDNTLNPVPEGTYFYVLRLGSEDAEPISGTVEVIRSVKR